MTKRFRHYDQAALDREYDNRAKVANAAELIAHYSAASAAVRGRFDEQRGIEFDERSAQTLDVFRPNGTSGVPLPIALFIHGGYWKALSKNEFSFVASGLSGAGALTVVIDYALIPAVDMAELVRQCRAACAWVWRNAAALGGDPARLFVSGHSAGGHLAAMMLATDWPAFSSGLPAQLFPGVCGISGLYDLEPIRLSFLNDELKLDEATANVHSPVRLHRAGGGALLLAVGGREGPEYLRQSRDLAAAWHSPEAPAVVDVMAGEDHFSIVAQLEHPDSPLTSALRRQMGLESA